MNRNSWRTAYLNQVIRKAHAPPLFADLILEKDTLQKNTDWANFFISMETSTPDKSRISQGSLRAIRDNPPLSVQMALLQEPFTILCGASGAGKSTILHTYTLFAAGECIGSRTLKFSSPRTGLSSQIEDHNVYGGRKALIPVFLDLSQGSDAGFSEGLHNGTGIRDLFEQYLKALGFADHLPDFYDEMEESGVHFFLDNADQLLTGKDESCSRWTTEALGLIEQYPKARITLAVDGDKAYWEKRLDTTFLSIHEIAPLKRVQIELLIRRWYMSFFEGTPEGIEHRLESTLAWLEANEGHATLLQNPFRLTLWLYVQVVEGNSFPQTLEELLERSADVLARRWLEAARNREESFSRRSGEGSGKRSADTGRLLLEVGRIISEIHEAQSSRHRLLPFSSEDLFGILSSSYCNHEAGEISTSRKTESGGGLFTDLGNDCYTLPHYLLQQFLLASYLAKHDFPTKLLEYYLTDTRNNQDILLLAAKLVSKEEPFDLIGLIDQLRASNPMSDPWIGFTIAKILVETGIEKNELREGIRSHSQADMVEFISNGEVPSPDRADAGIFLANLGDPRFRSDAWYLPNDPMLGFIEIPAGSFIMGTREEDIHSLIEEFGIGSDWEGQTLGAMLSEEPNVEELIREMGLGEGWEKLDSKILMRQWYRREIPQHELELPTYYIARFPVTNAQFGAFVEESNCQPEILNGHHGISNHPLAHVTWLDSVRYCHWLTDILRSWKEAPDVLSSLFDQGWHVSLPSEAEWEKAARGSAGSPVCTRTYPWGEVFDPNCANSKEAGLGAASTVGCFSQGASPYGVLDMAGNVWEWTRSLWGEDEYIVRYPYPYKPADGREERLTGPLDQLRVLRGGSYKNYRRYVRCTTRRSPLPVLPSSIRGFRLALIPPGLGL